MTDLGRGDYVTYREHMTAKEEAQKRMAAQELELATMRASLMHIPDDMRKLTDAVNALSNKMTLPQPDNSTSLALHHAASAMTKIAESTARPATPPPPSAWGGPVMLPWLLFFGLLGALLGDAGSVLSLVGG